MTTKKQNRCFKSLLSFVLALCIVFGAWPLSSFVGSVIAADGSEPPIARKEKPAAEGGYWDFYEDGEIWFNASAIEEITEANKTPWMDTVNREDIGSQITVIIITDSVKTIGANAFKGLKPAVVYIPASVTSIDAKTFAGSQISDVYYRGEQKTCSLNWPAGIVVHYEHAHTGEVLKHAIPATCTKEGYEGDKYCSLCGYPYAKGKDTEKAEHSWSRDYAYVKEPTCNAKGYQAQFCEVCGTFNYASQIAVPATGEHNWVVLPDDKFDDCSAHIYNNDNHIVMHCQDCNAVSTDEQFQQITYKYTDSEDNTKIIDSGKENLSELTEAQRALVVNAEEVEYNQGLREKTLVKAADDSTTDEPKAKHQYIYETTDPGCTQMGRTDVSCAWCNDYHDGYDIPATGHSDVALGEVRRYSIPATCTEDGEKRSICTVCGAVLSSEVIPDRHTVGYRSGTWVTINEPDCYNKGKQWLKCNYCQEYIEYSPGEAFDENGTPKTGNVQKDLAPTPDVHKVSRWFKTLEPTCTEKGEQIKICTVKGCPYYSDTDLGKAVCKISDRKALDELIAVTKDVNPENFRYEGSPVSEDDQVFDVSNEINMAILAAYKKAGFPEELTDAAAIEELKIALTSIFATAVDYHGRHETDTNGKDTFVFDRKAYDCSGEAVNNNRFVFSEIVEEAVAILIENDSVINTIDDVVAALNDAWTALGDETIHNEVKAHPDQIAKITDKSLAKQELAALGHDFVRCDRYFFINKDNEFVPAFEDGGKWYRIEYYDEDGEPVLGEELTGTPIEGDNINCVKGGGNIISQCQRSGCGELDEPILVKKGPHSLLTKHFAPTCTKEGYDETYCTLCDYKETVETDPPRTHDYVETTIKPSSCSKTGIKVKICSYCGDVNKSTYQTLALLPHTDSPVYEAATCTESGRDGKICEVCGRFEGDILPELGHDYKEEVVAPTCTELGYTVATCARCGDTKAPEKYVAVAGHQYGGKAISIAATCENGSYTYEQCKICGYKKVYNQRDNALGHQMVTVPAANPTCTTPGRTEKIYCTRPGCTHVEKESTVIPALGHTPKDVAYLAPTCTEDGHEAYVYCPVCGDEIQAKVVIPKLGHSWTNVDEIAPTCTEDGQTSCVCCERCGDYQVSPTSIPATGHEYGDPVKTEQATPFKSGTMESTCMVCGHVKTESYKLTFFQSVWWILIRIVAFPFFIVRAITGSAT